MPYAGLDWLEKTNPPQPLQAAADGNYHKVFFVSDNLRLARNNH
jgi:hypothetical protein